MTLQPRSAAAVDFEETRPALYFDPCHQGFWPEVRRSPQEDARPAPQPRRAAASAPPWFGSARQPRLDRWLTLTWLVAGALLTLFALGLAITLLVGAEDPRAERGARSTAVSPQVGAASPRRG